MKFLKYALLLFIHTTIPSLAAEQVEEGWRWKKTFILQMQEDTPEHSVDNSHDLMANGVTGIQRTLFSMAQKPEGVIANLRQLLKHNPPLQPIFLSLNADDKCIGDILKDVSSSSELNDYWLENKDLQKFPSANEQILHIIRQNLQRLCTRNIVLASFGTIIKGKYANIPILEPMTGRRAVFLSGTGNRLIELLEPTDFKEFTFITFDRPYDGDKLYDGFLKGNLGYVLSHTSERIPANLKQKSLEYKRELDTYVSAQKDLERRRNGYDECVQKMINIQPKVLSGRQITDSILRQSQTAVRDNLRLTVELDSRLQDVQACYSTSLRLIPDFFHSEQLLRLFLYNNLESLLRKYLPFEEIEQFLTIHIHSLNDVCERCAHCLFLESEMCNVITEETRPEVKKRSNVTSRDPYGFFEKFFNSVKEHKPKLKYLVLATSSTVGEQRGVMHRYQAGHDMHANDPIILSSFPPLLAFKVLPYEFHFQPLSPSLTPQVVTGSLYQSYFPTVHHK